jgi:hypothetical protein
MRILTQRTVSLSCLFNLLFSLAMITHGFYLPFYFQSVLGTTAALSGVYGLPYSLLAGLCTLLAGYSMSHQGHYVPIMHLGALLATFGSGLLYTLHRTSSPASWIPFQLLAGAGFGLAVQIPFIAVQVVLPDADMPVACAWVVFFRVLGAAVGVAVAENIFANTLIEQLRRIAGLDLQAVLDAGAANTELVALVPEGLLAAVREAYAAGVRKAFVLPIAAAGVAFVCSLGMERRRIMDDEEIEGAAPAMEAEEERTEKMGGMEGKAA